MINRKLPTTLNEYNLKPMDPGAMPPPFPEMLERMKQDEIKKEARRPLADKFGKGEVIFDGLKMPYRLYVPDNLEAGLTFPLVLFLHGGGEQGDDNEAQLLAYDGALVWTQQPEPCFVLAPQSPDGEPGWLEKHLLAANAALEQVVGNYPIDQDRLYLTGMSMGGGGCWRMNYMYPDRFAAIVPCCAAAGMDGKGGIDQMAVDAAADAFVGKHLWMFHAADDFVITPETTRSLAAALEQRGMQQGVDFFYTEYPAEMGLGHGSWEPAYQDTLMVRWVLAQSNRPSLMPPPPEEMPPEMAEMIARSEAEKAARRAFLPKFEAHTYTDPDTALNMRYRLYRPALAKDETAPLVVFLHGIGECGQDNEAQVIAYDGATAWVKAQEDGLIDKAFVLAPQCPLPIPGNFWEPEHIKMLGALLRQLMEELPIDPARVYGTGLSLGGYGIWNLIRTNPGLFAGAVTCCPACVAGEMFDNHIYEAGLAECAPALQDIHLWLFHAEDDNTVPVEVTKRMESMLRATGKEDLLVSIYPAKEHWGHGSWEPTYQNQEMITWLFRQRR